MMLGMGLASTGVISPLSDHLLTITFHWINVASNSLYYTYVFWWRFPNKLTFTKLLLENGWFKSIKTLQTRQFRQGWWFRATKLMKKRPCCSVDSYCISTFSFCYMKVTINHNLSFKWKPIIKFFKYLHVLSKQIKYNKKYKMWNV